MTIQEAINKVTSVCFSHLQDLNKEEQAIKDKEKFTADALKEEQEQLSKALNIVRETVSNLVDDGK